MATIRALDTDCKFQGCTSRAMREVVNDDGVVFGAYCKRHAEIAFAAQTKLERDAARPKVTK